MKNQMRAIRVLSALVLAFAAAAATGKAGETVDSKKVITTPEPKSAISGDFGIAVTNVYDSRGYALVKAGGMFQPYLDVNIKAYEGTGFINSVTPTLGLWSDINTNKRQPGVAKAGNDLKSWYEFDYMPGVAIGFANRWTLTETYLEFDSPSGGFNTARSINSALSYNDAGLIDSTKNFSIQPHVTLLNELPASGSAGAVAKGEYLEMGVAPNYTVGKSQPVTFTVPLTLAYGDHFYTHGVSFGYFSTGVSASTPLAFIPAQYGNWSANVGFKYFTTGDRVNVANFRQQEIVSAGIGCTF